MHPFRPISAYQISEFQNSPEAIHQILNTIGVQHLQTMLIEICSGISDLSNRLEVTRRSNLRPWPMMTLWPIPSGVET